MPESPKDKEKYSPEERGSYSPEERRRRSPTPEQRRRQSKQSPPSDKNYSPDADKKRYSSPENDNNSSKKKYSPEERKRSPYEERKRYSSEERKRSPPNEKYPSPSRKRKRSDDEDDDEEGVKYQKNYDTSNKVVVRNLSYTCEEEEIKRMFEKCGKIVEFKFPRWRDSGKSKGYAFVTYEAKDGFDEAIKRYDRYLMDEREIVVEEARGRTQRSNAFEPKFTGKTNQVFVGNISYETTKKSIEDAFNPCGKIKEVRLPLFHDNKQSKGFAFVEFYEKEAVRDAIKLNGSEIDGRIVKINEAFPPRHERRERGGYDRGYERERGYDRERGHRSFSGSYGGRNYGSRGGYNSSSSSSRRERGPYRRSSPYENRRRSPRKYRD